MGKETRRWASSMSGILLIAMIGISLGIGLSKRNQEKDLAKATYVYNSGEETLSIATVGEAEPAELLLEATYAEPVAGVGWGTVKRERDGALFLCKFNARVVRERWREGKPVNGIMHHFSTSRSRRVSGPPECFFMLTLERSTIPVIE